jgi:hypothetical protein
MKSVLSRLARQDRGQSIMELSLVLPILLLLVLGVVEVSFALLDHHIVTKLTREGSNLISRDTSIGDAATALRTMSSRPVDFDSNSRVIFSVIRNVPTVGAANYNQPILYQRYEYGAIGGASKLSIAGSGSFGPAPDYQAANSDNNTGLRVTNLPPGLEISLGGFVYVTEIYSQHQLITPFDRLGVGVPNTLYSIAYF